MSRSFVSTGCLVIGAALTLAGVGEARANPPCTVGELARIAETDAAGGFHFGIAVAISGDVAIVGANTHGSSAPFNFNGTGLATVYRRIGNTWTEEARLSALDAAPSDWFGISVAIEGNLAIVGALGDDGKPITVDEPTLIRMHRRNLLGDIFGELNGDPTSTSKILRDSMRAIQQEGCGAIVYLRPTGQGDALEQRLITLSQGIALPEDAPDLVSTTGVGASALPMHERDFGVGSQILRELGVSRLRLLTNHKKDLPGLDAFGIEITEHVPLAL